MDTLQESELSLSLPGDLVLRRANPADLENLLDLQRNVLGKDSYEEIKYLLALPYPNFSISDFLVVNDLQNTIVSALCLMETQRHFGDTVLKVGMPEFVSTHPDYRNRGLIRAMFSVIESWMQARGYAFGIIGGIGYFYRLFGYEYAVDMHCIGNLKVETHLGKIPVQDGIEVRSLVEADAPAIFRLQQARNRGIDIYNELSEETWRWRARTYNLISNGIEDWVALKNGQVLGIASLSGKLPKLRMWNFYGTEEVAAALIARALEMPGLDALKLDQDPETTQGRWMLELSPLLQNNYGWYIKVIDPLRGFTELKGEFEKRISASSFAELTRDLELGFYRFGICLKFESGKIIQINTLPSAGELKISIPPDLLPKLFFGYRDLNQLAGIYPDLYAQGDNWELLRTLFPRLRSNMRFIL